MNIAHVYGKVTRMHGATKVLLLFATTLQEQGHKNTIVCPAFYIPIPYWFKGDIRSLTGKKFKSVELAGLRKILSILLEYILVTFFLPLSIPPNTDVVVFHGQVSLFAVALTKLLGGRRICVYYCYQHPREFYDLQTTTHKTYGIWFTILRPIFSLYKFLDKQLVRLPDTILVWSQQHKELVQAVYGDLHFHSVPAGIDFSAFQLDEEARKKLNGIRMKLSVVDKSVLLMNASLTQKKNIPLLLKLVQTLNQQQKRVHGVIIGEGPEKHNLEELVQKLDIGDHITFSGYVSQEDLPLYYFLSDILYFLEPRGLWTMSVIEAGAAKKPVIVAPGGSMPTLVEHGKTGFILSEPNNEQELYDMTIALLNHPERCQEMGENNYRHSKQFAVERIVENFIKLLCNYSHTC